MVDPHDVYFNRGDETAGTRLSDDAVATMTHAGLLDNVKRAYDADSMYARLPGAMIAGHGGYVTSAPPPTAVTQHQQVLRQGESRVRTGKTPTEYLLTTGESDAPAPSDSYVATVTQQMQPSAKKPKYITREYAME